MEQYTTLTRMIPTATSNLAQPLPILLLLLFQSTVLFITPKLRFKSIKKLSKSPIIPPSHPSPIIPPLPPYTRNTMGTLPVQFTLVQHSMPNTNPDIIHKINNSTQFSIKNSTQYIRNNNVSTQYSSHNSILNKYSR